MLRLGLVDCDTSHVYQFARRLNHVDIEEAQWVEGAKVVAAIRGTSRIVDAARMDEYIELLTATGVEMVEQADDLIGRVDAVCIESNEGGVHLDRALPFIRAGLPVFIDKPFTSSTRDAVTLVEAADKAGVPLLSASSLRFAREVLAAKVDTALGAIHGADVHCPAALHEANPGLFHYGVHGVEMLSALLGPGCREVTCTWAEGAEVTVGRWADGRLGVMRGLRTPAPGYGFTVYGAQGITTSGIDTAWIYHDLLKVVVSVLGGAPSPVSGAELIEAVAFQEAALQSKANGGGPVTLPAT